MGVVVGSKIREQREAKKMTQEQLARAVGTVAMQISNWERDIHDPEILFLARIARFFEQPLEFFIKENA